MASKKDILFYEYIVVGCGGIGSATLYWLAKHTNRGVLGIEQFHLGHHHGGSQDHSRIIRLIYSQEKYTTLANETYKVWKEVEEESGLQLVFRTGSLGLAKKGTPGTELMNKQAESMTSRNIKYERLNSSELRQRYPQWNVDDDIHAIFQSEGGLVDPALGTSVHIQLARSHGAEIIEECTVNMLEPVNENLCLVHTTKGTFHCRRVILTAGAWLNNILGTVGVKIPLVVTQEQVSYFATPHVKMFTKENFPVFIYYTKSGFSIYGLPTHVNSGFKIAIDAGGQAVTPETRDYIPDKIREELCLKFMMNNLPKAVGPLMYTKTCLYTMTLDRDFILDDLNSRGMPQIIVCVGSGHAYKFASLFGKILSELAIDGTTQYDISGFTINREAVNNPKTKPGFWRGDISSAKL